MIAPIHSINESAAIARTDPAAAAPELSQADASSRIRFWIRAAHTAARKIIEILSRKGVLLTKVVACDVNRKHPEMALIEKPVHASFFMPSIDEYEIPEKRPSNRKSRIANTPTTIERPTA